jgi:hypothetical protein
VQSDVARPSQFGTGVNVAGAAPLPIGFFALTRPGEKTVSISLTTTAGKGSMLTGKADSKTPPVFYALPAETESPPATTVPLYEFVPGDDAQPRVYSTNRDWSAPGYERAERPLFRVWRNPMRLHFPLH